MTYKTPPEGPPLKALEKRKQPKGPPSQDRKYNTKGSEYRPGMKMKPKGIEVPAIEESIKEDIESA